MSSVKMVLVLSEGVLGYIVKEYNLANVKGSRVKYYLDGLSYDVFLHSDEYVVKFTGEISE